MYQLFFIKKIKYSELHVIIIKKIEVRKPKKYLTLGKKKIDLKTYAVIT
jgi:hypothetical protein